MAKKKNMSNDNSDLVRKVQEEMLREYEGLHSGVGISSLAVIRDLYKKGMYRLGHDSFPSDATGLCVTVNLLEQPGDDFEYVTEQDSVHIFYRVTGITRAY